MVKKFAMLGVLGLMTATAACSSTPAPNATATTSTTAAGATSTTAAGEKATSTTAKSDTATTAKVGGKTPVTKPAKVEKVDPEKLPASARTKSKNFDLTSDESDCVDTVVFNYVQDPANKTDDATLAGLVGGSYAACVDQNKIAEGVVAGVKQSAPAITDTQAECLKKEIAGTDKESLAIFLGAFTFTGEGSTEMQKPFIDALSKACNL